MWIQTCVSLLHNLYFSPIPWSGPFLLQSDLGGGVGRKTFCIVEIHEFCYLFSPKLETQENLLYGKYLSANLQRSIMCSTLTGLRDTG